MKRNTKTKKGCSEEIDEDKENERSNYEDATAEITTNGKYRCRDCGMLFETLKDHNEHYRKTHGQAVTYHRRGIPV
jgi:rubrerythrin